MVLKAADVIAMQPRHEDSQDLAIDRMTEKTEKIIVSCASQGLSAAKITVPAFMIGVPVYERSVVADAVMQIFRDNDFDVELGEDPDTFVVSWSREKPTEVQSMAIPVPMPMTNRKPLKEFNYNISDD